MLRHMRNEAGTLGILIEAHDQNNETKALSNKTLSTRVPKAANYCVHNIIYEVRFTKQKVTPPPREDLHRPWAHTQASHKLDFSR